MFVCFYNLCCFFAGEACDIALFLHSTPVFHSLARSFFSFQLRKMKHFGFCSVLQMYYTKEQPYIQSCASHHTDLFRESKLLHQILL